MWKKYLSNSILTWYKFRYKLYPFNIKILLNPFLKILKEREKFLYLLQNYIVQLKENSGWVINIRIRKMTDEYLTSKAVTPFCSIIEIEFEEKGISLPLDRIPKISYYKKFFRGYTYLEGDFIIKNENIIKNSNIYYLSKNKFKHFSEIRKQSKFVYLDYQTVTLFNEYNNEIPIVLKQDLLQVLKGSTVLGNTLRNFFINIDIFDQEDNDYTYVNYQTRSFYGSSYFIYRFFLDNFQMFKEIFFQSYKKFLEKRNNSKFVLYSLRYTRSRKYNEENNYVPYSSHEFAGIFKFVLASTSYNFNVYRHSNTFANIPEYLKNEKWISNLFFVNRSFSEIIVLYSYLNSLFYVKILNILNKLLYNFNKILFTYSKINIKYFSCINSFQKKFKVHKYEPYNSILKKHSHYYIINKIINFFKNKTNFNSSILANERKIKYKNYLENLAFKERDSSILHLYDKINTSWLSWDEDFIKFYFYDILALIKYGFIYFEDIQNQLFFGYHKKMYTSYGFTTDITKEDFTYFKNQPNKIKNKREELLFNTNINMYGDSSESSSNIIDIQTIIPDTEIKRNAERLVNEKYISFLNHDFSTDFANLIKIVEEKHLYKNLYENRNVIYPLKIPLEDIICIKDNSFLINNMDIKYLNYEGMSLLFDMDSINFEEANFLDNYGISRYHNAKEKNLKSQAYKAYYKEEYLKGKEVYDNLSLEEQIKEHEIFMDMSLYKGLVNKSKEIKKLQKSIKKRYKTSKKTLEDFEKIKLQKLKEEKQKKKKLHELAVDKRRIIRNKKLTVLKWISSKIKRELKLSIKAAISLKKKNKDIETILKSKNTLKRNILLEYINQNLNEEEEVGKKTYYEILDLKSKFKYFSQFKSVEIDLAKLHKPKIEKLYFKGGIKGRHFGKTKPRIHKINKTALLLSKKEIKKKYQSIYKTYHNSFEKKTYKSGIYTQYIYFKSVLNTVPKYVHYIKEYWDLYKKK